MFTVYVLYSASHDKCYVGYTTDLIERMRSHNELGSGWTKHYRPWGVIHTEAFATKAEAMARESYLKSGQGRAWIRDNLV